MLHEDENIELICSINEYNLNDFKMKVINELIMKYRELENTMIEILIAFEEKISEYSGKTLTWDIIHTRNKNTVVHEFFTFKFKKTKSNSLFHETSYQLECNLHFKCL